MSKRDAITHALAVTDAVVCEHFPVEFYKRCMYAAFGAAAALEDAGMPSRVVGGERKYLAHAVPAMTCEMVADIFNSGQGFGRSWTPDGAVMVASPPPAWNWSITLYIQRYDDMYAVRQDHFLGKGLDYTRQCGAGYKKAFEATSLEPEMGSTQGKP